VEAEAVHGAKGCNWAPCIRLLVQILFLVKLIHTHVVGRAVFRKNQHWNGVGSDRAATVREEFPASAIWRLEERVGTGGFEACLQGQHWGSGVLPVGALLVSEGVASPQHQKLVRGGNPESRFKRDI